MSVSEPETLVVAGPVLFARGTDSKRCRLAALVVRREVAGARPSADGSGLRPMGGDPVVPVELARLDDLVFLRHDFELPARAGAYYGFDGVRHPVTTDADGAIRIAFVSCNGMEHGDAVREANERNLMWTRLLAEHHVAPFALLLHGGDQLYADEASEAHPELGAWAASPLHERHDFAFGEEAERAATHWFTERYLALYADPDVASLMARVPSAMIWDDHDIFDGWGSHPSALLDSPVGRGLFATARRAFLVFQRALSASEDAPGRQPFLVVAVPRFPRDRARPAFGAPTGAHPRARRLGSDGRAPRGGARNRTRAADVERAAARPQAERDREDDRRGTAPASLRGRPA